MKARVRASLFLAGSLSVACSSGGAAPAVSQWAEASAGSSGGPAGRGGASGEASGGRGGDAGSMPGGAAGANGGTTAVAGANGGISGVSTPGGSGGAAGQAGSSPSVAGAAGLSFEERCLDAAVDDCEECLCTHCSTALERCSETSGCPEIAACIQASGCAGVDCYCGTFDVVACAGGQANGACRSAILEAPGGSVPTLQSPSAGPAADAAVAIGTCMQPGGACAASCEPAQ
jgi:hypothetical protein